MTDPVPSKGTCTDCLSTEARDGKVVHKDGCSHVEIVRAPLPSKDLSDLLVDTAQLLDGWKQTSPQDWSDWDQSVRDRLSQQLALLEASKHVTAADLATTVDARLTAEYWKAEHLAGNAEIERLQITLRGIQSCSTCEACRGAATLALGGTEPAKQSDLVQQMRLAGYHDWASAVERLQRPAHEREPPHCSTCECSLVDVGRATQEGRGCPCKGHPTNCYRHPHDCGCHAQPPGADPCG